MQNRTTLPLVVVDRPLIGIFVFDDKPRPLPILGYRDVLASIDASGERYETEWIPVGHDLRSSQPVPRCQGVYENREVFDALNAAISHIPLFDFDSVVEAVRAHGAVTPS